MNTIQAALGRQLEKDVAAYGAIEGYRAHVLQHLQLRTVIREHHNTPIIQLAVHMLDTNSDTQPGQPQQSQQLQATMFHTGLHNLVATIGADQVSVYDDLHFGNHVGLVAQFNNGPTLHHKGGALRAVCWLSCRGYTQQLSSDAWLAVAGCDHVIQILSIADSRVIIQLHGHTSEVVDLCAAEHVPGLLLSLAQGGCVRLWHVPTAKCLACLETQAHTAVLQPCGTSMLTGHRAGQICHWDIQQYTASYLTAGARYQRSAGIVTTSTCQQQPQQNTTNDQQMDQVPVQLCPALPATHPVDCIRFLPGGQVMLKTSGGHLSVWSTANNQATQLREHQDSAKPSLANPNNTQPELLSMSVQPSRELQCAWLWHGITAPQLLWAVQVPDARTSGAYPSRCLASHCQDGSYICCGDTKGTVHVYHTATGAHTCQVGTDRVEAPVRACGLSHDCRHLWAALGDGFVFRYEYVRPGNKTNKDVSLSLVQEPTETKLRTQQLQVCAKLGAGAAGRKRARSSSLECDSEEAV